MHPTIRRLLLILLAATGLTLFAPAIGAFAASGGSGHTVTTTQNFHVPQSVTLVNPCNGDPVNFTEQSNIVSHTTYFPASDEGWMTFTEEDSLSGVDPATQVTYTGHDTSWGNGNFNQQNSNSTFTTNIQVRGSDGSSVGYHEVGHFTINPDGTVTANFDKVNLTCGT